MALYPCPECKREISTDAKACPHCGKRAGWEAAQERWKAMPKALRIGLMGAVVFFAFVMAVSNGTDKQPANAPAQAVQAAATASPKTLDGRMTIQPGDWIGYRDRDTLERATKLAVQGDRAAYTKLMGNGITRGICTMFKPGEEVFVEDTAMLAGLVKIRRKGETDGWWTNFEAVR